MDTHTRITAALHIVIGVLGASTMLIFALGASWLRSLGKRSANTHRLFSCPSACAD